MRRWFEGAAGFLFWGVVGCGGASGAAAGPGAAGDGRNDGPAGARGVAAVEFSHVSQFEPSSTTYVVRPDGSFERIDTGQDYGYVGRAVFQPPLPADVTADLFERVAAAVEEMDLVEPARAYQPPSTALTSDEVVVVLADGSRRMAATEEEAQALLEATAPAQGALFERTRVPDGSQAGPTPEGWVQMSIEVAGTSVTEPARAVPAFQAALVSDGQWWCTTFVGAVPAEDGRTVYETRTASGRVDAAVARELLRAVLDGAHPSTGRLSAERADAAVRLFHIDHGWGTPTAEGERAVLEAWRVHASRLDPGCLPPDQGAPARRSCGRGSTRAGTSAARPSGATWLPCRTLGPTVTTIPPQIADAPAGTRALDEVRTTG